MDEDTFADKLAALIEATRDAGLDDEAIIALLKDTQAALEEGQS